MSYGRVPYYIYSNGNQLFLDGKYIDEEVINAFLYKILLTNRREELKIRLQEGKNIWLSQSESEENIYAIPKEHLEKLEDDIFKKLLK